MPDQPQEPENSALLAPVLNSLEQDQSQSLSRLKELLSIPSISTDPAYKAQCGQAAQWCTAQLSELGFDAQTIATTGHPMVLAHYEADQALTQKAKPLHVLFYGHYDVQPPDPLELWRNDPFDPHIEDHPDYGKILVARGASDDKGQLMTFIEACRAWKNSHGGLPLTITVLFEGEEECGSPSLEPFLESYKQQLGADIALICDTGQWDQATPAITTMLRGLAATEIEIEGPSRDLHSGLYGGPVRNPIAILAQVLASLRDSDGTILIPHFYDDIIPPSQDQLQQWQQLGLDAARFLEPVGLKHAAGEKSYSLIEQLWARPSCEINGIAGGYQGVGTKTVIPSKASAKITFRLVPGQDPAKIIKNFEHYICGQIPADCKVTFSEGAGSPAIGFETDTPYMHAARKILEDEFSVPPLLMGCGGSIPIVERFKSALNMDSLLIGFALEDDQIHAPNEKYNLSSFYHGARAWARLIGALSELEAQS